MTNGGWNDNALDADTFDAIAGLAYRESGLQLVEEKKAMIQSRLRHRLVAVGLENFASYASFVCSQDGVSERIHMISALTTNVSHFFREKHHFEILTKSVLAPRLAEFSAGERLRIWSAGCSNGQEPLSIVMSVLEAFPESADFNFRVLATDIDPRVIQFAATGIYPQRFLGGVPDNLLQKYFEPVDTPEGEGFQASASLLSRITYRELNLLSSWPLTGLMDAIFCRNVVIYFDQQTQDNLWPKFRQHIHPQGSLFLGHSERIAHPSDSRFRANGPTTYLPICEN